MTSNVFHPVCLLAVLAVVPLAININSQQEVLDDKRPCQMGIN